MSSGRTSRWVTTRRAVAARASRMPPGRRDEHRCPVGTLPPPRGFDARAAPTARSACARTARCSQPACAEQWRPALASSAGRLRNQHLQRLRARRSRCRCTTMSNATVARWPARTGAASVGRGATAGRARAAAFTFSISSSADLQQPVGRERGRLLHEVDRARRRARRAPARPTRCATLTIDDRHRTARHLRADETDAVELRHDQVAGDDVGLELLRRAPAPRAVARGADDLDEAGCATASADRPCGRRRSRRRSRTRTISVIRSSLDVDERADRSPRARTRW